MASSTKNRVGPGDLGIDLSRKHDPELFKWLVAVSLFSKPIQQEIAADAFRELDREGLTRVNNLRRADWQHVVDVLGRAHYKRYDESTATRLIELAQGLDEEYGGSLNRLHDGAGSRAEVQRRLEGFTGIGEKGAQIFLREAEGVWENV